MESKRCGVSNLYSERVNSTKDEMKIVPKNQTKLQHNEHKKQEEEKKTLNQTAH